MEIKVSCWKNEFVGPCLVPMDKVLFYSAQLILKLVQRYKENDHINGITYTRAKLIFLPMFPFSERKNTNPNNYSVFVIGAMLSSFHELIVRRC